MSRTQAALAGTRQIFVAILGCTATLIFAFLPLLVLPGTPGKFIRVLPMAVVVTIIGSLLIALFIIPFLASRVLKRATQAHGNVFLQRVMGVIHRYYRPALHWCLARPKLTVLVAIGGSLLLSAALRAGHRLQPVPEGRYAAVPDPGRTPNGTSASPETDRALRFVEDELRAHAGGAAAGSRTSATAIRRSTTTTSSATTPPTTREVFVQLHEYDTRRDAARSSQALRERLARYPGAHIYVQEFANGPPISAPIAVRVIGHDLDRHREPRAARSRN